MAPDPLADLRRLSAEMERLASPERTGRLGSSPRRRKAAPRGYFEATRTATYGFLAALPLFALYEVGVLLVQSGRAGQIRIGADVWLKQLLAMLGLTGWGWLLGLVLLVGAVVYWAERHRRPPLVPRYFGLIVAEGVLYAVLLAGLVGGTVGLLFGAHAWPAALPVLALSQLQSLPPGLQIVLSIGAGLYEELVFRVLLVGGSFLMLQRFFRGPWTAYAVAALAGAFVFSAVHHTGPFGDPFLLSTFTFRFLFGLALNAVFLLRGFALAAWTHALYDVLVVTGGL
ncbi:MAG: type II CAAX prenyl endopeptidase Rce1 family protein [Rubricoccaceae bacterium]